MSNKKRRNHKCHPVQKSNSLLKILANHICVESKSDIPHATDEMGSNLRYLNFLTGQSVQHGSGLTDVINSKN